MRPQGIDVGKISRIEHKPDKQRYWIYVDGQYCTSIRERTFPALKLSVGVEITCAEIKERENFFWKQQYGPSSWEREGVRLGKVKALIDAIDPRAIADVVGFGAGSTQVIAEHPEESGRPDIEVVTTDGRRVVLLAVEVTGTERMRGDAYWVRPDKLAYIQAHPEQEVWLILHYAEPEERFVFIRPTPGKSDYKVVKVVIREATEHFVEFTDSSPEVVTFDVFSANLIGRVNAAS